MSDTLSADERPETYRAAAALMRERPGPWEVAYDPPDGNPSDPGTKLCLVAAIQEACNPGVPGDARPGEQGYDEGAFDRARRVFRSAVGWSPFMFYREYGAIVSAGILDTIAARLEADRA